MKLRKFRSLFLALSAAALLAGCAADDETPLEPNVTAPELFDRYVALGNSITAGIMSAGINDSTQALAYPVLLARQVGLEIGTDFVVPFLARPGCPPPLVAPFGTARVTVPGQTGPISCALRVAPTRTPNNLAVPNARLASALDITVAANALTTFILGGRTPVQRMLEIEPTLVTSWLGNNDALAAAATGNVALLTPTTDFGTSLEGLVDAIEQTPAGQADAVVLIGVVDPVFVPVLQPGVFAFLVAQNPQTAPLLPKPVNPNCSPVTATGQPNALAFNRISLQALTDPNVAEISCASDAPFVATPTELGTIRERVVQFNALIEAAAEANGWIFVDPNNLYTPLVGNPAAVRLCQGLTPQVFAQGQQAIFQAVATTCPSPDPSVGFGALISFDAVHPSPLAHRIVANTIIEALNANFGLSIPRLEVPQI